MPTSFAPWALPAAPSPASSKLNAEHLGLQTKTSDITGTFSGISKVLRMILQSAVLGLGAYLTIKGELTAGAIIAASVASARALAPVDLAISQWKDVVAARRSYARLGETLTALDETPAQVELPNPTRDLKIEKITVAAPSTGTVVLSDVSLELKAGQATRHHRPERRRQVVASLAA